MSFTELIKELPQVGMDWHRETLLENTRRNFPNGESTIRAIRSDPRKCLIISAGPSLYRQRSLDKIQDYAGVIVATDGAYIQCLKHHIVPDYVLTIDPHPTRIVRWFGDLDYHANNDGYFERQDLDISFRENPEKVNQENIKLVDDHPVPLVIACSAPENVVARTQNIDRFWFVPLVDDPEGIICKCGHDENAHDDYEFNPHECHQCSCQQFLEEESLTRQMMKLTGYRDNRLGLPAMNTGGTVGNCAWVFAHSILQSKDIACIGMDFAYYMDTPLEQTQSWNMLKDKGEIDKYYPREMTIWGEFYTDPTYFWYRQNLLDLLENGDGYITNATEGGLLYGSRVKTARLTQWLKS